MGEKYKKYKELTKEEKFDLFTHWVDGVRIEVQTPTMPSDRWSSVCNPSWLPEVRYRKVLEKPSIDWDQVHPDFKYLCTDKDGTSYLFKYKPTGFSTDVWKGATTYERAMAFASLKKGSCDWKDSLIERPSNNN